MTAPRVAVAAVLVGLVPPAGSGCRSRPAWAEVAASETRLEREEDATVLKMVPRGQPTRLRYVVMLVGVPAGTILPLECDWLDPGGALAHRNVYETKAITRSPWRTYCRHVLPAHAAAGSWTVRMRLGDRELGRTSFDVWD